jgi:hypothetical protein
VSDPVAPCSFLMILTYFLSCSGGQNCITQTLKNLESVIGPLSVENVVKVAAGGFPITSIPKNFTCTNCLKEAYNIVKQDFSAEGVFATQEDNQVIQEQCGADFTGESGHRFGLFEYI